VSLHHTGINSTYETEDLREAHRKQILDADLKEILKAKSQTHYDHKWFMTYANRLYEEGISCLDIIKYLEEDLGNEKLVISLKFCFNKIKNEYRCEKMAMFYLFDYAFLRSNKSLKNISFI
jgi:hypothetical protein